jgi:glycosyltransferase involved in cell wall biosynthesis
MASVLYVSYDGMLEPLGQSQVITYLERLADEHTIHIISFEKRADLDDPAGMALVRDRLSKARVGWTPMRYHSRPSAPATAYDILRGQAVVLALVRRLRADIIHVRSYVPALMALPARRLLGTKLLFDIRGFWPDERVDGGLWPKGGALYRTAKKLERNLFRVADHVVTLTHASVPIIDAFGYWNDTPPPITVIPTCADLDLFAPSPDLRPEGPFTVGYVGSFGTWYLLDETMHLFKAIRLEEPDARMLIVNRHEHDAVRAAARRVGIDVNLIEIAGASHRDVPNHIHRMHCASALIKPCFSKISSAPTKLAEYLGCGVPCVGNTGVGDMEIILEGREVGVTMHGFDGEAMRNAARRIVAMAHEPDISARCRNAALDLSSLTVGVEAYRSIYQKLSKLASMPLNG